MRALVAAMFLWAALPAPAIAQTAEVTQELFDEQGDPFLIANSVPDGSKGTIAWAICLPGAACTPAGEGNALRPGPQPAGTNFEATLTYEGNSNTDRSRPWGGRVKVTTAPQLQGAPIVGTTVTPIAAQWAGGWGTEFDDLRVQVCQTPQSADCVTLSAPMLYPRPGDPAATVPTWAVGQYLLAADGREAQAACDRRSDISSSRGCRHSPSDPWFHSRRPSDR